MAVGIFVICYGQRAEQKVDCWLRSYDPDGVDGRGRFWFTKDPALAKQFADAAGALACYGQVSIVRPVRGDGRPNRPLTAFTIEIGIIPDGKAGT